MAPWWQHFPKVKSGDTTCVQRFFPLRARDETAPINLKYRSRDSAEAAIRIAEALTGTFSNRSERRVHARSNRALRSADDPLGDQISGVLIGFSRLKSCPDLFHARRMNIWKGCGVHMGDVYEMNGPGVLVGELQNTVVSAEWNAKYLNELWIFIVDQRSQSWDLWSLPNLHSAHDEIGNGSKPGPTKLR